MSLLGEVRTIGRRSGAAKRALTNFWIKFLRALHESRRREAERAIYRYRDLVDRQYAASMESRLTRPSTRRSHPPT